MKQVILMNKKVILLVLGCMILVWCYRIFCINQIKKNDVLIQIGEEFQEESITIVPLEAHLFSRKNFLSYFDLNEKVLEYDDENGKYICVSLWVTNVTKQELSWDLIMELTTCGFETKTWASITDFNLGSKINEFQKESLGAGQSQKIWYVTAVNPQSFKNKTWEKLKCKDFSYILSLVPEKIKIKLE